MRLPRLLAGGAVVAVVAGTAACGAQALEPKIALRDAFSEFTANRSGAAELSIASSSDEILAFAQSADPGSGASVMSDEDLDTLTSSSLDIAYDLGEGHPLLGRRMPDLDVTTADGPARVFALLHDARPVLLNLGEPGALDVAGWADRVERVDADYEGPWELPALGTVTAPDAVLIRPDGHVAWVGEGSGEGLDDAGTRWFGAAQPSSASSSAIA